MKYKTTKCLLDKDKKYSAKYKTIKMLSLDKDKNAVIKFFSTFFERWGGERGRESTYGRVSSCLSKCPQQLGVALANSGSW